MRCAVCGYDITDANAITCPNCGQPLPVSTPPTPQYAVPPSAVEPPAPQYSAPFSPLAPPAVTGPYSQPMAPPAAYGPYSQPMMPPAPGSMPLPPAPWQQTPRLSEMLAPLPPVRKRKFRVVVPLIAGIAVIAVIAGLLVVLNGQESTLVTGAANSTATASAPHTPVAVVAYQNTFAQSANGWPLGKYCSYGSGGLHVNGGGCFAPAGTFDNLDVKVTVEQISGSTVATYGVTVRAVEADTRYDILIDSDSQWGASRCDAPGDQNTAACSPLLPFTSNSAIHGGLNTQNTIEVRASGSHFEVTINGVNVGSFDDSTYSEGQIGLIANGGFTCVFNDFTITRYA